jgi:hypothetical protein
VYEVRNFAERSTLVDWVNGRGYLELVETPYHASILAVEDDPADKDGDGKADLLEFEARLRPLDPDATEKRVTKDMARRCRRSQTLEDHHAILLLCSIGSFVRMCQLNVDSKYKIGPLIDLRHGDMNSSLVDYKDMFGSGGQYLSRLGRAVQMSPTTHPIRTYDPKVLLLMLCNSGADARKVRRGREWINTHLEEATDLFFNCIIVEVVKVEVLVEWSLCFHGVGVSMLPKIDEIPCFLDFVAAVLKARGSSSTKCVNHDQYLMTEDFKDHKIFIQFFNYLRSDLPAWFSRQSNRDDGDTEDLFGESNNLLVKFINNGIVDAYVKQPFHCQHIYVA